MGGGSRVFGGRPTFARIFHFRTDLTFARIFRFSSPHFRKLLVGRPQNRYKTRHITKDFVGSLRSPQDRSLRSEGRSISMIYDRFASILAWRAQRAGENLGVEGRFDRIWPGFRPVGGTFARIFGRTVAWRTFARIFRFYAYTYFRTYIPKMPSLSHTTTPGTRGQFPPRN